MVYPLSLQEDTYDEINAELQMMHRIAVEEQEKSEPKVFVGSGDIHTWEMKAWNKWLMK